MEHESFEDPETAAYMNEHFVSVKVDREERPDVDAIYMQAVQAMTGHGGWPLNAFLDPDGVPVLRRHLLPARAAPGDAELPPGAGGRGRGVAAPSATRSAPRHRSTVARARARSRALAPSDEELSPQVLDEAERGLAAQFDPDNGGFGGAPKFPPASALEFLMARGSPTGDCRSSDDADARARWRSGGIYDQVGGGFARYSVDAHWLVPHFEKMLYDNALLARAYLHGWQLTGDELFRRVCEETLDWALREMRGPEGGFYSALDADSEGEEGKFYVWTRGGDARRRSATKPARCSRYWGVDRGPNFEGRSILHVAGATRSTPSCSSGARRSSTAARASASGRASTTSA